MSLSWSNRIDSLGRGALLALTFFIPISTGLTNICIGALGVCWILGGQWAEKWRQWCTYPLQLSILAMIAVATIGLCYSPAPNGEMLYTWANRLRWLYIPIWAWFLRDPKMYPRLIDLFLCAMALTVICGLLKVHGVLTIGEKYTQAAVFKDHIKTNFLMAFASYFCLYRALYATRTRVQWGYLFGVGMTLYYGFFLSMGRTGYVMFGALLLLGAVQRYGWRGFWGMGVLFSAFLGLATLLPGAFHERALQLYCERLQNPASEPHCAATEIMQSRDPTSIQLRTLFIQVSWSLFQAHPWLGTGTGSFPSVYHAAAEAQELPLTDNPHSAYLYIMVESGLLGLLALSAFFIQQARALPRLTRPARAVAEAAILAYGLGCIANAWLIDFTELHFWIWLLVLAYGEKQHARFSRHHDL